MRYAAREVLTVEHLRDERNAHLVCELPLPTAPTRAFLVEATEVVLGYLRQMTFEWQDHGIDSMDAAESIGEASCRLAELAQLLPAARDLDDDRDKRGFGTLDR
jgi:hypothetical protein